MSFLSIFLTADEKNLAESKLKLAERYISEKYYDDAHETYQDLLKSNPELSGRVYFQIGELYKIQKSPRKALTNFLKVTVVYKGTHHLPALIEVAKLYHYELNEFEKALDTYKEFYQLAPKHELASEALFHQAVLSYTKLKKREDAIQLYLQVNKEFPKTDMAHKALEAAAGIYQTDLKKHQEAIDLYKKIDAEYPQSPLSALYIVGTIYEQNLNDKDNALKYYEEFVVKYPKSKDAEKAAKQIQKLGK